MGFEDYQVMLYPRAESPLVSGGTPVLTKTLAADILREWSAFTPDDLEMTHQEYPARPGDVFLVYETPGELFQMEISLNQLQNNSVQFSLRFAYCNPHSVYEPFCQVITRLMERYHLVCHPMRDFAPPDQNRSEDICSSSDVRCLLIPSMDYNRRFWFLDAQTDEEAALRPGDAVARFIMPRLQPLTSEFVNTN